jgi:predicted secreted protein
MAKDGYVIALRLGGTVVTGRTNSSLSMNWDMLDATTADSAQNKAYLAGDFDGEFSVEGKLGASDTYSTKQLKTAGDGRTPIAAAWGELADDAPKYTGNVLISKVDINAPINGVVTWSATLKITGGLSETTYTTT